MMYFVDSDSAKVQWWLTILLAAVFVNRTSAEGCGQEELSLCSKPLQILSSTSELSFVTNKAELDKLCPDLHLGLQCIHRYTERCMTLVQRTHFNQLYHGTNLAIQELCVEGPYQESFLRHAPCMSLVKPEYDFCARQYQMTMLDLESTPSDHHDPHRPFFQSENADQDDENKLKLICCSFQIYMDCSQRVVMDKCGQETAHFTKQFLDRMASSLIKLHCDRYIPDSFRCQEPSSGFSITSCWIYVLLVSLAIFFR